MKTKQNITKAVFPVAGLGTRFLPVTKAMPKELLPIVDKPLIQYAAEEAVAAGLDTLIFVTGRNKRAIEDHFDRNIELEDALLAKSKKKLAHLIANIMPRGVECVFVRQSEQLGLGHAVLCAERAVGTEPFAVLLADDFIVSKDSNSITKLVNAHSISRRSQLLVAKVDGPDITKYGVIEKGRSKNSVNGLIEKPSIKKAPSNLASIGRYILNPEIFQILKSIKPGANGELQLADAINVLAKSGKVESVITKGKRFDCGSIHGYIKAINFEYKRRFREEK